MRTKKQIEEIRHKKGLHGSASQIDTVIRCKRLHHFQKVSNVIAIPSPVNNFIFGTIQHGVIERWLKADNLGNDKETGLPVDLYPDYWYVDLIPIYNEWGEIAEVRYNGHVEENDQERIKNNLDIAIEQGTLVKHENARIEEPIDFDTQIHGLNMVGYIDWRWGFNIRDHKTTGNPKWCASSKKNALSWIGHNTQLNIYAIWALLNAETTPKNMSFGHIYYGKKDHPTTGKPWVKEIKDDTVPTTGVTEKWTKIIEPAIHKIVDNWNIVDPLKIDIDEDGIREKNACMKYGGCPYRTVCDGREDIISYEARSNRLNQKLEGNMPTGLFDKARRSKATREQALKKEPVKAKAKAKAKEVEVEEETTETDLDELYEKHKKNSDVAKLYKRLERKAADLEDAEDDEERAEAQEDFNQVKSRMGELLLNLEGLVEEEEVEEEEVEEEEVKEEAPAKVTVKGKKAASKPKGTPGRKPDGLRLYRGVVIVKGMPGSVVHFSELFAEAKAIVEEANGDDNFYTLDTWKRRDMLKAAASTIAEARGSMIVQVNNSLDPEAEALYTAFEEISTQILVSQG